MILLKANPADMTATFFPRWNHISAIVLTARQNRRPIANLIHARSAQTSLLP